MYTNTFKNKLTTGQKRKLLLNTCGILFYCRNGAKSYKTYATVQGSLLWFLILFDFILNVNNFSVMSGRVFLG